MLLYWFHNIRSAISIETRAIQPRMGAKRKRMKQNMLLNTQKHAGTYEEASDRSGVTCIWCVERVVYIRIWVDWTLLSTDKSRWDSEVVVHE